MESGLININYFATLYKYSGRRLIRSLVLLWFLWKQIYRDWPCPKLLFHTQCTLKLHHLLLSLSYKKKFVTVPKWSYQAASTELSFEFWPFLLSLATCTWKFEGISFQLLRPTCHVNAKGTNKKYLTKKFFNERGSQHWKP